MSGTHRLVVRAKQLWTGLSPDPITSGALVIEGEVIRTVARSHLIPELPGDLTVDLPDGCLLPGYIDMHSHVSFKMTSPRTPYAEIEDAPETIAVRGTAYLHAKLRGGVTTVRAMSERSYVATVLRDAIDTRIIDGPALLVAGRGLKVSHGWGHTGTAVVGEDQIRGVIRENVQRRAALTKIFLTNNGAKTLSGAIPDYFTNRELTAAIDESHRAGVPIAAHCVGGRGAERFIRLGGDTIEHGFFLTDAHFEEMHRRGTWLIGTIGYLFDRLDLSNDPDGVEAKAVAGERYVRAVDTGVPFAVGTDDAADTVGHELACLVRHGLSVGKAVEVGAAAAARCLGLTDRGTLESGRQADVVGLLGDPRDSPDNFERIGLVIRRGEIAYDQVGASSACDPK